MKRVPGRSLLPWIAGAVLVAGLVLVGRVLPLGDWIRAAESWFRGLGTLGVLAFAVAYVAGTVLLVPGSALTILGGLLFGWWGVPLVVAAAWVGTCIAFLIARHLARDIVARRLQTSERLRAIDAAVDAEGWKVVLLLRLSPLVPFGLQNYLLGLTGIGFWPYALATLVGIVPGTALYVSFGVVGQEAAQGAGGGAGRWIPIALGVFATLAVTVIVGRRARQMLDRRKLNATPGV